MKYVLIAITWAVVTAAAFWFADEAYTAGYEQGYRDGQERALMSPQSLQTCTKWWFDGSEARAKQAMNQYCERNKK
jgi:hypothetical protein